MVQIVRMNSANYLFDNKNDAERVYDIQSNILVENDNMLQSGENGTVREKGNTEMKCSFNISGIGSINYSFYNNVNVEEQVKIIQAIEGFMTGVTEKLSELNIE